MKTIIIQNRMREILIVINKIVAITKETNLQLKVFTTGVIENLFYDTYEERDEVYDKLKKAIEESEE